MNQLFFLWGAEKDLNTLQMCVRAFVIFLITMVLLRIGGIRIFGKKSSFDIVITIILGAVLSRIIVGASPFIPTACAALVMVLIHRILAWACFKNEKISRFFKGEPLMLYQNGNLLTKNLSKAAISESDVMESLRLETKNNNFDEIDTAFLETNGRISFIKKPFKE